MGPRGTVSGINAFVTEELPFHSGHMRVVITLKRRNPSTPAQSDPSEAAFAPNLPLQQKMLFPFIFNAAVHLENMSESKKQTSAVTMR